MRALAAMIVLLAASGPLRAADAPWCYRDFGSARTDCSYYSARHCLARVGAFGGTCERNHPAADKPAPKR